MSLPSSLALAFPPLASACARMCQISLLALKNDHFRCRGRGGSVVVPQSSLVGLFVRGLIFMERASLPSSPAAAPADRAMTNDESRSGRESCCKETKSVQLPPSLLTPLSLSPGDYLTQLDTSHVETHTWSYSIHSILGRVDISLKSRSTSHTQHQVCPPIVDSANLMGVCPYQRASRKCRKNNQP